MKAYWSRWKIDTNLPPIDELPVFSGIPLPHKSISTWMITMSNFLSSTAGQTGLKEEEIYLIVGKLQIIEISDKKNKEQSESIPNMLSYLCWLR